MFQQKPGDSSSGISGQPILIKLFPSLLLYKTLWRLSDNQPKRDVGELDYGQERHCSVPQLLQFIYKMCYKNFHCFMNFTAHTDIRKYCVCYKTEQTLYFVVNKNKHFVNYIMFNYNSGEKKREFRVIPRMDHGEMGQHISQRSQGLSPIFQSLSCPFL